MSKICSVAFFFLLALRLFSFELPDWAKKQIEDDFRFWHKGISFSLIEETYARRAEFYSPLSIVIVYNGRVYGPQAIRDSLKKMAAHYKLPNVIFFCFNSPGPIAPMKLVDGFAPPIMAGSKIASADNVILIFHRFRMARKDRYSFAHSMEEVKADKISWENKEEKLFWRGAFSDSFMAKDIVNYSQQSDFFNNDFFSSRLILVEKASKYPDLLDVKFTEEKTWVQFLNRYLVVRGITEFAPFATIAEHLNYKYQINIDGLSCTYPGYIWRLFSNTCTFKVYSPNIEWFSRGLQPWVHFIPLESDLSDLIKKVKWAKEHDSDIRKIVQNANNFSKKYLTHEFSLFYTYCVLSKYASLQKISDKNFETMIARLPKK